MRRRLLIELPPEAGEGKDMVGLLKRSTPLVKCKEEDMDKTPLETAEAALYRSIAMRIGYLSMDRPDMLRTVRELAKGLKEPQQHHCSLLKRCCKISPRHSKTGAIDSVSRALHEHQWLV